MGFTKLDEGIVHSSIWSEALATRVLWVTMLAMADSNGFVSSSRSGLLRAANIPEADFNVAIEILEAPDPDSRSPEHGGRRIEKCDGGWMVLNYRRYREFTYSGSKEAIKKRRQRDKRGQKGDMSPKGGDISASASSSEDKRKGVPDSFDAWWSRYPRKVEKKVAEKAYAQAIKAGAKPEELSAALDGYRLQIEKDRTEDRYIKHASTFLHEDRWRDFLPKPKLTAEEFRAQHEAEVKKGRR